VGAAQKKDSRDAQRVQTLSRCGRANDTSDFDTWAAQRPRPTGWWGDAAKAGLSAPLLLIIAAPHACFPSKRIVESQTTNQLSSTTGA